MAERARWRDAEQAARVEADRVAAQYRFGGFLAFGTFTSDRTGCLATLVGLVLVLPGIGLAIAGGSPVVQVLGGILVVAAVVLPAVMFRRANSREHLLRRLHAYEGGLVFTGPDGTRAHRWTDIAVSEKKAFLNDRLYLRTRAGVPLCVVDSGSDEGLVVRERAGH
ncbi:hypothetical protein [Amycolatopsis sp. GM8]|uniref:hypothetical protein n=1 Tax=Amycolatopsis sp. GM8 TaxID=2896530 RepID=UPI001F1E081E|nr:hypothetical protein [Amycolatopsis sp. GM8]